MQKVTKEVWKKIPGFKNYEASSFGRFRSIDRLVDGPRGPKTISLKSKVLKKVVIDGYEYIGLRRSKKGHLYRVGRILYRTFYGRIPNGIQIHHKDHNRINNKINNLEAISAQKNMDYQIASGRHPTAKNITKIQYDFIREYKDLSPKYLSMLFNCSTATIWKIRNGKGYNKFKIKG